MNRMTLACLLGAAAALSACGGGGGGGDGASSPSAGSGAVQAPPSVAAPGAEGAAGTETAGNAGTSGTPADPAAPAAGPTAPVGEVPPSTYTAGSVVASAFETLNGERARCGFGKVAQNAQLDAAAAGHTSYLQARWNEGVTYGGHLEDPAASGHTAATPGGRAASAGYGGTVGEYLSYHYYSAPKDYGNALVRTMLASVYNQIGMLDGNRDVGAAADFALRSTPPIAILTWLNGTRPGVPQQDASDVLTYPCDGSSGVQPYMYRENPDPFSGLGLALGAYVGHPLYLRAPAGRTLRLAAATMSDAAGRDIPVALYHAEHDPQHRLTAWQAFVVPRVALQEGTTYTVRVQGSTDGAAFSRVFSFTTLRF